jgi:uncharacterized protein (DUF433 family)
VIAPIWHITDNISFVPLKSAEPVFKRTRVTLRTVLASLAIGDTPEAILADFPSLTLDDVRAAIAFAAASAEEDLPTLAVPPIQ